MKGNRIGCRGWLVGAAVALAGVAGCDGRDEVTTYEVPREGTAPTTAPMTPPMMAGAPAATTARAPTTGAAPTGAAPTGAAPAGQTLAWTVPDGWTQQPGERTMRVATFTAGEGDAALEVVVSRFPGDVGGRLANVNRWRGQVQLPPIAEADLATSLEPFEGPGVTGDLLRLDGPASSTVAAIVRHSAADQTWFVKATGPKALVDRHDASVRAFAKTFRDPAAGGRS